MKGRVTLDTERYMAQEAASEAYYHAHKDEAYEEAYNRVFFDTPYLLEMIIDQSEQSTEDEELLMAAVRAGITSLNSYSNDEHLDALSELIESRDWFKGAVEKERDELLSIMGRYE